MMAIISWSRDSKGKVQGHTFRDICNTITTFAGGGICNDDSGMSNTTPYVLEVWQI